MQQMRATNRTDFEMVVAGATLIRPEAVIDVKRKRLLNLFTRHKSLPISDCRFPIHPGCCPLSKTSSIGNRQLEICSNGWPTPAASPKIRESNADSGNCGLLIIRSGMESTGLLLATFSNHSPLVELHFIRSQ